MSHRHRDYGLLRPPGPRLLRSLALHFVNRHAHGGKRSIYAELNLTSMVDMLTILVVFLLQTFSASGELFAHNANVKLPISNNYVEISQMPLVVVSHEGVAFKGEPKETSRDLAVGKPKERLDKLGAALEDERTQYLKRYPKEKDTFSGPIMIYMDLNVPSHSLIRVVSTCTAEQYSNVKFLVEEKPVNPAPSTPSP